MQAAIFVYSHMALSRERKFVIYAVACQINLIFGSLLFNITE